MSVAELILQNFKGNPEYVALAADGRTFKPYKLPEKDWLTPERIDKHIQGEKGCLGFYLLHESKVSVSCVDFDNHGADDGGEAIMHAKTVARFLIDNQFDPLIEISQSGRGCHVWLKHDPPCEAFAVRQFWAGVLQQCQLTCEVYPRQSSADGTEKGLGNLIRYPLYGQSHFIAIDGTESSPEDALSDWREASAYRIRTQGELWAAGIDLGVRKSKFETDGLPESVAELLNTEELLQRRWAGDASGLNDQSRSAIVMSMAVELVKKFVPTPEIMAAIQFWAAKEGYEKAQDLRWVEMTAAKAYGCMKSRKVQKVHGSESLAVAMHKNVDWRLNGHEVSVLSGIDQIDESIGGGQFGESVVVACHTSNGKSAIGLHWGDNAAMQGYAGMILTNEMSPKEIAERMEARLDIGPIETEEDAKAAREKIDRHYANRAPIEIVSQVPRLDDIEQAIRHHVSQGVRWVVVDHMGLIRTKSDDSRIRLEESANKMRDLAKELNILVIPLVQIGRKGDQDGDSEPRLSWLQGSAALEQAADSVIFGRWLYKENPIDDNKERYVFYFMKRRNGKIKYPVMEGRFLAERQMFA